MLKKIAEMGQTVSHGDVINTPRIARIEPAEDGYEVYTIGGERYRLDNVRPNPLNIVVVNGEGVTTCRPGYVPISNSDVMDVFTTVAEQAGVETYQASRSMYGGQYRMMKMIDLEEVSINGEDLTFGIGVGNSYDLTMGIHLDAHLYRLICSNGMFIGDSSWRSSIYHMHTKENLYPMFTEQLESILNAKDVRLGHIEEMMSIGVRREHVTGLMRQLRIQKKEINDWMEAPQTQSSIAWEKKAGAYATDIPDDFTAWDLMNDVTNFANQVEADRRFYLNKNVLHDMAEIVAEM